MAERTLYKKTNMPYLIVDFPMQYPIKLHIASKVVHLTVTQGKQIFKKSSSKFLPQTRHIHNNRHTGNI